MTNEISTNLRKVPTSTGMVVIPASLESDVAMFHYAPARRVGDFVYLSGIVVSARQIEPASEAEFCDELRSVFRQIGELLVGCGANLEDVVELQMFHVFGSKRLVLDKVGQLAAIARVRDEFFVAPYPIAVELGVASLNSDDGIVEIKAVAFAPQGHMNSLLPLK